MPDIASRIKAQFERYAETSRKIDRLALRMDGHPSRIVLMHEVRKEIIELLKSKSAFERWTFTRLFGPDGDKIINNFTKIIKKKALGFNLNYDDLSDDMKDYADKAIFPLEGGWGNPEALSGNFKGAGEAIIAPLLRQSYLFPATSLRNVALVINSCSTRLMNVKGIDRLPDGITLELLTVMDGLKDYKSVILNKDPENKKKLDGQKCRVGDFSKWTHG